MHLEGKGTRSPFPSSLCEQSLRTNCILSYLVISLFHVVAPMIRCYDVPDSFWAYCQQFNRVMFKALRNALEMDLESLPNGESDSLLQSNLTHFFSVRVRSGVNVSFRPKPSLNPSFLPVFRWIVCASWFRQN